MTKTVTDILKFIIGEVNASEKLTDAAKSEFAFLTNHVVPQVILTLRLPPEYVTEAREEALQALKKYGAIDYSIVYDMEGLHYFHVDLKTIWFENLQCNPELMGRSDNSEELTSRPGRTSEVPRVHFQNND